MDFAELVRIKREKTYSTPRKFFHEHNLPCSYFYYTKVEKGTAVPTIDIALAIISKLKINLRKGLYAWVRAQMPDNETKALFAELDDVPTRSAEQMSIDRSLVINRMQAKLIASNPVYWEVLLFISCHYGETAFSTNQLAKHFKMTQTEMRPLVTDLFEFGLLNRDENGRFYSMEWIFIPYEEEFVSIRDSNFFRALEKFRGATDPDKFRTTITRMITDQQKREVQAFVSALQNWIIDLPDESPPHAKPYTVGIFASERTFGNA
jgi:hypothetical protein